MLGRAFQMYPTRAAANSEKYAQKKVERSMERVLPVDRGSAVVIGG
jgi:hypothetical protein